MYSDHATVIKVRSFDHEGRSYDVSAFVEPATPSTFTLEISRNGRDVYYDYPDGFRTMQQHDVSLVGIAGIVQAASMNAADYTMDNAEQLVRCWVK